MDQVELARQVAEQFDKRLTAVENKHGMLDQMAVSNSEHIINLQKSVSDIASDTRMNSNEIKHLNTTLGKLDSTIQSSTAKVESTVSEIWRTITAVKDGIGASIEKAMLPIGVTMTELNNYGNYIQSYPSGA